MPIFHCVTDPACLAWVSAMRHALPHSWLLEFMRWLRAGR